MQLHTTMTTYTLIDDMLTISILLRWYMYTPLLFAYSDKIMGGLVVYGCIGVQFGSSGIDILLILRFSSSIGRKNKNLIKTFLTIKSASQIVIKWIACEWSVF